MQKTGATTPIVSPTRARGQPEATSIPSGLGQTTTASTLVLRRNVPTCLGYSGVGFSTCRLVCRFRFIYVLSSLICLDTPLSSEDSCQAGDESLYRRLLGNHQGYVPDLYLFSCSSNLIYVILTMETTRSATNTETKGAIINPSVFSRVKVGRSRRRRDVAGGTLLRRGGTRRSHPGRHH
jgi:hypothetical protein